MGQAGTSKAKLKRHHAKVLAMARSYAAWFTFAALVAFFAAYHMDEPFTLSCLHAPLFFVGLVCAVSAVFAFVLLAGLGWIAFAWRLRLIQRVFSVLAESQIIPTAARALAVYTPPPGIPRLASHR